MNVSNLSNDLAKDIATDIALSGDSELFFGFLLLETGFYLLLETGGRILLE